MRAILAGVSACLLGCAGSQAAPAQNRSDAIECPRGEPEAVFRAKALGLASRSFRPRNQHAATETVTLVSGATLTIEHSGCDDFALTIAVEPAGPPALPLDARQAYAQAAEWLLRLHALGARSPFDLEQAAKTLRELLAKPARPGWGQEFAVDGDGTDFLQTRVTVHKPPAGARKGSVRFSLVKGPL